MKILSCRFNEQYKDYIIYLFIYLFLSYNRILLPAQS